VCRGVDSESGRFDKRDRFAGDKAAIGSNVLVKDTEVVQN
jgi:hypothetical protein